jgi:hypothetical protein
LLSVKINGRLQTEVDEPAKREILPIHEKHRFGREAVTEITDHRSGVER